MSSFSRIRPGFRESRRRLDSVKPRHFRLLAGLVALGPGPFTDLGREDAARVNAESRRYFERGDLREFWLNKPFSDPAAAGWLLARFGHLVTALDLRPGDRVLDFGCGTGWSSDMLARMGMDVVGMDISPAALELAREASARRAAGVPGAQPRFEVYSGDRLEYPDGHFDAVVVFDAFHHLPNPQGALGEFHRVLAANCRLGMAEPGVGHSDQPHSRNETRTGVLEREIDLEQLYRGGLAAGFGGLEALVPGLHPHGVTLPARRLRWYLRGLSWLLPANHVRLALLGAPVVLLWKGPHFISSLHPREQSAVIRPSVRTASCRPGQRLTIGTDVTNASATVWLREGRHGRGYVRLGVHLLDADQRTIDADFARAPLPLDMNMHDRTAVTLAFTAPETSGRYVLRFDMVNEGIGWFADGRSETADVALTVT
jgi:SAM-dependent methyltransferase